jgi:RNA 2',3'-cyclic 3'-phosphodiesterase
MPDSPGLIRAFAALPLPPGWIGQLLAVQKNLQRRLPFASVRWTKPDQIHLTLRFFGDVPAGEILNLVPALRAASQGVAPFLLGIDKPGGFPHLKAPRVIWLGLARDLDSLLNLQARIERATRAWGEPPETRGFHPHLTLARIKGASPRECQQIAERLAELALAGFDPFRVQQLDLLSSELRPEGPVYTRLAEIQLPA